MGCLAYIQLGGAYLGDSSGVFHSSLGTLVLRVSARGQAIPTPQVGYVPSTKASHRATSKPEGWESDVAPLKMQQGSVNRKE